MVTNCTPVPYDLSIIHMEKKGIRHYQFLDICTGQWWITAITTATKTTMSTCLASTLKAHTCTHCTCIVTWHSYFPNQLPFHCSLGSISVTSFISVCNQHIIGKYPTVLPGLIQHRECLEVWLTNSPQGNQFSREALLKVRLIRHSEDWLGLDRRFGRWSDAHMCFGHGSR